MAETYTLSIPVAAIKRNRRLPLWLVKMIRFEFWPYYILYIPVFFYYLWLSLKARSLTFFTAANPGIFLGGLTGESKSTILKKIDPQYLPHNLYFNANDAHADVLMMLQRSMIAYPFIIKPDMGERGNGVEKIYTEKALLEYLGRNAQDFMIQEFVPYELELGVLHYHTPDGKESGITSIVVKEFLTVTGDGFTPLKQLIEQSERAQLRQEYLLTKFSDRWDLVLAKGDQLLLEPIGNHCRGTTFLNGNMLITPRLVEVFDSISRGVEGFYIGRYDLKVCSLDDLYSGRNIRIVELNGIASEPAHIYDPHTSLREAYRALFNHYRLIYTIAIQQKQKGVKFASFSELWNQLRIHFSQK
jgi:hypothetical protein